MTAIAQTTAAEPTTEAGLEQLLAAAHTAATPLAALRPTDRAV